MAIRSRPAMVRYGYGLLSVLIALAAALLLRTFDLEGFLFVIAVAAAVWFGGRGPGILAVVLSVVILDRFFLGPWSDWEVQPAHVAYFSVFTVLALAIGMLSEARQRAEASLVASRDALEAKVRERTADLERSNERLRAEAAERVRASEALRAAQAELARVSRVTTLGEATASFAHELNQPLAAISNNANACLGLLAGGHGDAEEIREALGDIVGDAERASAIIERVRALLRRSPPARERLRVADVVDDVVALAAGDSSARRVGIRTEVAGDVPPVCGDRVQLQQVLLNLVVNALDAMRSVPESERSLEISARSETRDGEPTVVVRVRDRGSGLDGADVERLFDAFYTTKDHGTGMGLAISRSIVEAHGGRLWAERNVERGATFGFSLPPAAGRAHG